MDKKLQSESFYVFHTKAKPFSVQHFLNFEILGALGRLLHDDDGSNNHIESQLFMYDGMLSTPIEFDPLEFDPLEFDSPPEFNLDDVSDSFSHHWDLLWELYQKNKSTAISLSNEEIDLTFDVYRLRDYIFHPTTNFLKLQKDIFSELHFAFVKLPSNYKYEDFVLSSSEVTKNQQPYVQSVHINKTDNTVFPWVLYDIEPETKQVADSLPLFKFKFTETLQSDFFYQFSARLPINLDANSAIFCYLNNEFEGLSKLAFYWFGKPVTSNKVQSPIILTDTHLNQFLLDTGGLGLIPDDKRTFLHANAGIPSQQIRVTEVDGEMVSENILKGYLCITPYSFVVEYARQIFKPSPLNLLYNDNVTVPLFNNYNQPSVWSIGFIDGLSDNYLKTPSYPINVTNPDGLTKLWDVSDDIIFNNAIKFDGELFCGTGISEITISPFSDHTAIYSAEFGDGFATTTEKIITGNRIDTPSLFSIKTIFTRQSEVIEDVEDYDENTVLELNNLRFFIYDDDDQIIFISETIDDKIELNYNSVFEITCLFRFLSVMGETIEEITII